MIPPPPTSTLFPYTTLFRSLSLRGRNRPLGHGDRVERRALHEGRCGHLHELRPGRVARRRLRRVRADSGGLGGSHRSEEHTSELQSHVNLVCRLLLEKKNKK